MNELAAQNDLHSSLCQGRTPFAVAELHGKEKYSSIRGRVDFYSTPAGVLVSAKISGLPSKTGTHCKSAVYGLCLEEYGEHERKNEKKHIKKSLSSVMPPLYERDGKAWCSVVTGKLLPSELCKKSVRIWEGTMGEYKSSMIGDRTVASGVVVQPVSFL